MDSSFPETNVRAYPSWLDQWWRRQAVERFAVDSFEECQSALERQIQHLSDLFTTERASAFGDYGNQDDLLLAYGLFYFPQTFVRAGFPLREAMELRQWVPAKGRPARLLDLGAGLGGALMGAATALLQNGSVVEATAVDRSARSLAYLRRLATENEAQLPGMRLETVSGDLRCFPARSGSERSFDLIIASFSIGEAFFGEPVEKVHEWIRSLLKLLEPGGILILLEPALHETSERIEQLRDRIAAEKSAWIWGPCPHHHRCPLLADGKFWCHEVKNWAVPESLAFLNRRLFRSIALLKYSFLTLGNQPPAPLPALAEPAQTARLITPMSEMKGKFVFAGCAADGERHEFEIQKRNLAKKERREIAQIERGEMFAANAPGLAGRSGVYRLESPAQLHRLPASK